MRIQLGNGSARIVPSLCGGASHAPPACSGVRRRRLTLADPYDRYDDYCDGYSFVNANRFYWMWFDALYFDKITWRTTITATPRNSFEQKSNGTMA